MPHYKMNIINTRAKIQCVYDSFTEAEEEEESSEQWKIIKMTYTTTRQR